MTDTPATPTSPDWALLVCQNLRPGADRASCKARGSGGLLDRIEREVRARGLRLAVEPSICMGKCTLGPTVRLAPGGPFFQGLSGADVPAFLDRLEREFGLVRALDDTAALPPPGT